MSNITSLEDARFKKVVEALEEIDKDLQKNNGQKLLAYWDNGQDLNLDLEYCEGQKPLPMWARKICCTREDFYYMQEFAATFTREQVEALTQLSYMIEWQDIVDYLFHKVSAEEILEAARASANRCEFIGRLVMMRPEADYSMDILIILDLVEPKINKYELLGRLVWLHREPFLYDDPDYLD